MVANEELIKLVVHRFGVSMGAKLKGKQLRREIQEAKETPLIRQKRQEIKGYVLDLLFQDYDIQKRKELRGRKRELEDQVYSLKVQRYNDTKGTREERRQLSDVVFWIDETKLLPELEAHGMMPEQNVNKEELVEAHKYKEELREAQKKKRR